MPTAAVVTKEGADVEKTKTWEMLVFAIARFTIRAVYTISSIYLVAYYESLGASILYISAYIAVGRCIDCWTDPVMGWITETRGFTYKGRTYRRKNYLLVGSIGYNIFLLLLFMPPKGMVSTTPINHWFGLTYIFLFIFDTVCNIPYYSFGMELATTPAGRDMVWFYNILLGLLGVLFGAGMPAGLTFFFDSQFTVYAIVGITFAAVHASGILATLALLPERSVKADNDKVGDGGSQTPEENASAYVQELDFVCGLLRLWRNKGFRIVVVSWFMDLLAIGTVGAMLPYYVGYVLLDPQGGRVEDVAERTWVMGLLALAVMAAGPLSMPFWLWCTRRFGKFKTWIFYSFWNSATCPFFMFVGHNKMAAYLIGALNGSAVGGQFLAESMNNDLIAYDEFVNGDSMAGFFVAINTFLPKIVLVMSLSLPLAFMAASGYVPMQCPPEDGAIPDVCDELAPEPQPPAAKMFISICFSIVPTVSGLISIALKLYYPINQAETQMIEVAAATEQHSLGKAVVDPITGHMLGSLCISRIPPSDPKKAALVALAHFPVRTLKKYKAAGRDPSFVKTGLIIQLSSLIGLFVGCTVVTILTFDKLNDLAWGWAPILAFILAGALAIFILGVAKVWMQVSVLEKGISEEVLDMYLNKWEGKNWGKADMPSK